jgi:UPF0716 protein FxsA
MVKHILVAILLLPIAELAVFVLVAALIGALPALALLILTTLAGAVLLRLAGRAGLTRFRVAVADSTRTEAEANRVGFVTVLAGILLVIPGFLTDLVALALLIGPVRRWAGRTALRWLGLSDFVSRNFGVDGRADRSVVDLSPDEWKQVRDREIENRSKRQGSEPPDRREVPPGRR